MKILLIEDEKDIINFLKPSLEANFYIVDTAVNGEDGSFMARTNYYDVILLDYILPDKKGCEICKDIREENQTVKIIMCTIKSELLDKKTMFELGVDDYITKPFLFEELLLRVKAVSKRAENIAPDILEIDTLEINLKNHVVKRNNREIYLTRKEFCLLEYLMKNEGQTISRAMILENVWDINADPFSNTIESHVLNLRRKLEKEGEKKLIYTMPARGYKLENKKF